MKKNILTIGFLALILLLVGHFAIMQIVHHEISLEKDFSFSDVDRPGETEGFRVKRDQTFAHLDSIQAMKEIEPFDAEAQTWSNSFSLYGSGMVVFDANGDDLLDVYFCNNGQNWIRPTDENGVLLEEPRYQHNALYLNQGNDEEGNPVYLPVSSTDTGNDQYVEEELLVENYFFPRKSISDSKKRWGRQSGGAVAADLNGDGRLDLLVGNALPGMMWTHPKTQRVIAPFISPTGRQARRSRKPLEGLGMYFINYEPRNNIDDVRETSRGQEPFGANSLFLNLGDRDGDGIPEWKDVSRETGIEGKRATTSFSVVDFDLDGDLDVFVANANDPDYWPGGSEYWAGGANQIYINQIRETGEFKFTDETEKMNLSGLFSPQNQGVGLERLRRIPFLPEEYSLVFPKLVNYMPEPLVINGQASEQGQISWASIFQDVNDDGYPDIWVANDLTQLELYINQKGKTFKKTSNVKSDVSGNWMAFAAADFNGDLKEDLFAGNLGGGMYASGFVPDPLRLFNPVLSDSMFFSLYASGHHDIHHLFVDGSNYGASLKPVVQHSAVLPPDAALENNMVHFDLPFGYEPKMDRNSTDPYGFIWGSVSLDVQNDGLEDLYFFGNLFGRSGGLMSVFTTGPGTLLVNATKNSEQLRFVDLTAEHHLYNIHELKYDRLESDGYIYRKAPTKNWSKRDMVYSYDRSSWVAQGRPIREQIVNHDLTQTAENGRVVVTADLNGDGFEDVILRNVGGYDSRSSSAKNLKGKTPDGSVAVLAAHDNNYPVLTNFEPGSTRVFMNSYRGNNWIKVKLVDDSKGTFNRDAIGARVVVNGKAVKVNRATQGTLIGNHFSEMIFGLGSQLAREIEITWPDKDRTVTQLSLDNLKNGRIVVLKSEAKFVWEPYSG